MSTPRRHELPNEVTDATQPDPAERSANDFYATPATADRIALIATELHWRV